MIAGSAFGTKRGWRAKPQQVPASAGPLLLGGLLMAGTGGPQDTAAARAWFERGTRGENADPDAMMALGRI